MTPVSQVRHGNGLNQCSNGGCGDRWLDSTDISSRPSQQNLLLDEMCGMREREESGMTPSFCLKQLSGIVY